ncbi:hypothetical protein UFOVP860_32 [uncultured Caudovirales phage]|uniref:Uncharacterized protein n=1 Tax=uncultured Caudovirales phage TaxID=2100421 RepID=A0A6J5T5Y9_9CAUD|nr:hypothetical protein UFOVP860_32 [uncultured Caudovirales phage]CAB4196106.1 hypothetical protein UFOVP1293_79 [uncultured Caudovirales phage]CAB4222264.1 hypothetical protein UFOVP1644_2 [uncultured Caudovirales phage]
MAKLLSLDLSTAVGWAKFAERGERPRFGTLLLVGGDLPQKLGQFDVWLEDQYAVDPFEALAWERPLITPTDTVPLLELLYGLVGICHAFVGRRRILDKIFMPWREIDVPTAKLALTGNAKADKDAMLFAARRQLNWEVSTHHEADAGAVGGVAYEQIWPKRVTA